MICTVLISLSSYYSDLSLWDIHRTQTPLLALLRPDVAIGIVHSLVAMSQEGGALPRWPIANGVCVCVVRMLAIRIII